MNILNDNNIIFYPLTHPQKRIWYIDKIYPNTSLYNIGGTVRVKGQVEFTILEESINMFIKRNEGLRIRFVEQNGEAKQYVSSFEESKLDFVDFSMCEEPLVEFENWIEKQAQKPFVLENERLFYFALFRVSDECNGYFVKFHHIIADGWSINIMTNQICDMYMRILNKEDTYYETEYSYIDYINQEQKYLSSDRFLKNKIFWNEKFEYLPERLPKRTLGSLKGKRKTYELDNELSLKIKEFAAANKYSLNTFFVTLYLLLLNIIERQDDIIIGTPVLNRSGAKEKNMFGMFTSTMPFRFVIDKTDTILQTMKGINAQLTKCFFNQKYPYDLLVQDLELKKKGIDSLFDVCVNYYSTKLNSVLDAYLIENHEFYNGNQSYALQLVIKEWANSGNLTLAFDYKLTEYTDEQVDAIYNKLINITNQVILNPNEKVERIGILVENDIEKLLYEFNNTQIEYPRNRTIYELFEEQVEKTPDKIAVSFNENEVTYKDLNDKSNQLAKVLVRKGVRRETIVGLLTTHSIESVIGILAILKAGAAYLPLDPKYPNGRISYILEDSHVKALVTNFELTDEINFSGEVINISRPDLFVGDVSNLNILNRPDELAYLIYTSGSTGKPKGTMIEHQGLVNYIWWAKKMYVQDANEVFPLYSSLAFDLTVTSIFTPLISGNKIIVYDDDGEEFILYRIIKENRSTIIKLTPSHLTLLKDINNCNSTIKRFIVGGEKLTVELAKYIYENFGGNIEIINEYGPTETVVGCMIHKYDYNNDIRDSVPIGTPSDNVQIYILDENLNPVYYNVIGEIYISGDGVARGYLNKPEITQEKFIENPFIKEKRMYKSGDLARFLNDGKIEYIGRIDHQVKISGYRIELGEIEKCLLSHKEIEDAVVITDEYKDNSYLCAYIVKRNNISEKELRHYLIKYLPNYMIPLHFIEIDKVPISINGKVNINLLPKPIHEVIATNESIVYKNKQEEKLISAISEVLNIDRVSTKDNFYHLGGDSIKAIQIASKLNANSLKLKIKDMLMYPTIEEMALCIEQNDDIAVNQEEYEGIIEPSPIIHWFLSENFEQLNYYNQLVILNLKESIEINKLEIAFNALIKYHDSLRINYSLDNHNLYYNNNHMTGNNKIQVYDLSGFSETQRYKEIQKICEELSENTNLEEDILIKACVFNFGHGISKLVLIAHHLIVDGISWRIIIEDLCDILTQIYNDKSVMLPKKMSSFKHWTERIKSHSSVLVASEKAYWENILAKSELIFPIDHNLGEDLVQYSNSILNKLNEEDTELFLSKANLAYNTKSNELLITALLLTLKGYSESKEIVIEIEDHGREELFKDVNINRTVGWFTSMYPISIQIGNDYLTQIQYVKEKLNEVSNRGIGFGVLKYIKKELSDYNGRYIRFNNLGDLNIGLNNRFFSISDEFLNCEISKKNHMTCMVDINTIIINNKLTIITTYSKNKFKQETMEEFAANYIGQLKDLIKHCCNKEETTFSIYDFDIKGVSQQELDSLFLD